MDEDYSLYGTNSDSSGGLLYNLVLCAIYIGGAVAVLQILGQVLQGIAGSLREGSRGKTPLITAEPPAAVKDGNAQVTETLEAYHARKAFERSHSLE